MNSIRAELIELFNKYKEFDFEQHYKTISTTNTNNKYSKGWGFKAGLYEPSFVNEMIVTNTTIGKEINNIDKGYNYKYYFNEHNEIIMSERGKNELNFYFYNNNILKHIFYIKDSGIYSISKSFYDIEGKLIRHIKTGDFLYDIYDSFYSIEQMFEYKEDATYIEITKHTHPNQYMKKWFKEKTEITKLKLIDNILYYLDDKLEIKSYHPIRFKLVNGKKVNVPLPKKVPIFKIIKNNIIKILNKWKDIDISVIWINVLSTDLELQYQTIKTDCEEKWNIAYYEANEEKIFDDPTHPQVLENLLFNNGCNIDDLINESEYFVNKMIKIIKELRKEGYIKDVVAVILSDLEISEKTFAISKKINKKEIIKEFINC